MSRLRTQKSDFDSYGSGGGGHLRRNSSRQHLSGSTRKSAGMIRARAAAERNTSIVTDRASADAAAGV